MDIAGLQWLQWGSILLTLVTNGYMIHFITKQQSKTFLDWMIVFDSGLCINQCYSIAAIGSKLQDFCSFSAYNGFFVNLCNRLLTIGILLYRYFFVVRSSFVQTGARRRMLSAMIFIWIMATSIIMTSGALYYEDYNYQYLGD